MDLDTHLSTCSTQLSAGEQAARQIAAQKSKRLKVGLHVIATDMVRGIKVDAEIVSLDWDRAAGPILVSTLTNDPETLCLHPWEIERKPTTVEEIDALLDGTFNRRVE